MTGPERDEERIVVGKLAGRCKVKLISSHDFFSNPFDSSILWLLQAASARSWAPGSIWVLANHLHYVRTGPTLTHHHADLCRLPEPNPGSPLHPTGPHLVFCTSLLFIFPHTLSLGWCIYITISESNKLALMSKGRESIKAGSLIRGIGTVSQRHHKPKPHAKHIYILSG